MRVSTTGQVILPRNVREVLGITPKAEIDFIEENGKFYIVKIERPKQIGKFKAIRGIATAEWSTDAILDLTRNVL